MDHQQIAHCVETLCQEGCSDVRATITLLERGGRVPQLAGLNEAECQVVLEELRAIMAVYDRR